MDGYSTAFPHSVAAVRSACPLANDLEGVFSAIHWALGLRVSNRRAKIEFHCLPGIAHRLRCVHSLAGRGRSERWNVRNARREGGTDLLRDTRNNGPRRHFIMQLLSSRTMYAPHHRLLLPLPLRYGHELRILRGARHVYRNERVRSPRRIVSTVMEREGRPARGEEGARGKNAIAARPRAKDSGWAELLHIIIITVAAAVVIVVNGVESVVIASEDGREGGRGGCLSVSQSVSLPY